MVVVAFVRTAGVIVAQRKLWKGHAKGRDRHLRAMGHREGAVEGRGILHG